MELTHHCSKLFSVIIGASPSGALIDLQKAYDTVNREKLWRILLSRCKNEGDDTLALLIIKMCHKSQVIIGRHSFSADLGFV